MRHLLAALALLALGLPTSALAAVPGTIVVEGAVRSAGGGPAADGVYKLAFALYPQAQGGTALWKETTLPVQVAGGLFVHTVGAVSPVPPAVIAAPSLWFGVTIEGEPELPRAPLHSVLLAVRAAVAEGVDCTGCIGAGQLDKALLQALAKTADLHAVAVSGKYTDLAGAPDLSTYVQGSALADVAKTGAYADLKGAPGVPKLPQACGSGLVVKGLKADGALDCVAAVEPGSIPTPSLAALTGGLLVKNADTYASSKTPLPIPDNDPGGVSDSIVLPDLGAVEGVSVQVDLDNSEHAKLTVKLFDPQNGEYLLHEKTPGKGGLAASFPPQKLVAGDLGKWAGKNPAGKWTLVVQDGGFFNNKADGAINAWSLTVTHAGAKKLSALGGFQFHRADSHPVACTPQQFGFTYANPKDKALYICNGKEFYPLSLSAVGTQDNPGKSCKDIQGKAPGAKSGVYWITAGGTFQVYCNMDDYGGGWTLALRAGLDYDLTAGNQTVAVGSPPTEPTKPANGAAQKLSDDVINQIRTNAGGAIGYWVLTPGDGNGKYGAEIFHRSDCTFKMQQNAGQVKATSCNQWTVDYSADKPNWQAGTHWHDSDTASYGWAFGYLNSVNQCQPDGKGLGVHSPPHHAFHRGWCGSKAWGMVYVR